MSAEGIAPLLEKERNAQKRSSEKKSKKRQHEEEEPSPAADSNPAKKRKKNTKVKSSHRHADVEEDRQSAGRLATSANGATIVAKHFAAEAIPAEDLERQLEAKTPFLQQTTSFYLPLAPVAHSFPLEGLCAEHVSPLLLTYFPPLKGVVLSYSNPRLSEHPVEGAKSLNGIDASVVLSKSVDEYAVSYVWLTADFTLFRPKRDTWLEGYVNLQNESILGLICYNYFSAGIERQRLPKDWRWLGEERVPNRGRQKEGEGHFVDAQGKKVEGRIVFKVKDFEAHAGGEGMAGSINILGTLLGDKEDRKADDEERQAGMVKDIPAERRLGT